MCSCYREESSQGKVCKCKAVCFLRIPSASAMIPETFYLVCSRGGYLLVTRYVLTGRVQH